VLRVAFELTNSGESDADEVVQIYGRDLVASVARPVLQLIGFNRVSVPAGETVTCKFRIDLSQFAYFNEAMDFLVEPGDVELRIGSSSDDIKLQARVRLTGEPRILSQRQVVATQATAP
jgi:beta-glucosidase